MSIKEPYAVNQLMDATRQLHASRLYERFCDRDCFLIRMPKLDEPALAVLMGNGGETFGLNLFLGPQAIASYRVLFESGGTPSRRALQQMRMVGYQMSSAYDLTHDARRWLKKAKAKPTGDGPFPDPMSLEPGKVPQVMLKDHETKLLLSAVRGILNASEDEAFTPNGIASDGRVLCLTLRGAYDRPDVAIDWQRVAQAGKRANQTIASARNDEPVQARFELSGLSSNGDDWMVGLMPVPGHVEGDDRQPYMLVVCSKQTNSFHPALLMGTEPSDIVETLAGMMHGEASGPGNKAMQLASGMTPPPSGLPARLIFDSAALLDAAAPAFEHLGIDCVNGSGDLGLRQMLDDLEDAFNAGFDIDEEDDGPEADDAAAIPGADDLQGWKRVDGWLKEMIYDGFDHDDRFWGNRALSRYFGPDAEPKTLFNKYRQLMVIDSYALWFTFDYRSSRKRPTLAEQWLAESNMPAALTQLMQAIIAQAPSLYRVEEADEDTGKITLADLFTGEITIATDFGLSTCLDPGDVLTGKTAPVGAFHFFYAMGPLITGSDLSAAMDLFDQQRINPSPDFFRDQPHVLGWLWHAIDQHRNQPRDLRNSDGHELLFHDATLNCTDRRALERLLDKQPDWHPDGDSPDDWVWLRTGQAIPQGQNPQAKVFETHTQGPSANATVLAQLEVNKRELTLHTNSRERHKAACTMLTKIHSVKHLYVLTHDPAEAGPNASAEEEPQETDEIGEEQTQAMREYLTNYYRQWLDQPNPSLKNKTPRQAAKHQNLRTQLAAMIRAMPDPTDQGSTGIMLNAPRQMLLAELELDNEPH